MNICLNLVQRQVPRTFNHYLDTGLLSALHQFTGNEQFFYLSMVLILIGAFPIVRFLYFYLTGNGSGHIQSLVIGGAALLMGFITLIAGMVADLISFNRRLIEMTLEKVRRLENADETRRASVDASGENMAEGESWGNTEKY